MRYVYDFEFDEDGWNILPISMGMVAEDGREFYRISKTYLYGYRRGDFNPNQWVVDNVLNHITEEDVRLYGVGRVDLKRELVDFISDHGRYTSRDQVELWGWYAAYDHVSLAQIFGRMIDLPEPIPMFTNELETIRRGRPKPDRPADLPEHHALNDAKYQMLMLEAWNE